LTDRGYSPRAFRYWVLTGHYRTPMNFTWEAIEGADQALKRLTRVYLEVSDAESWKIENKDFLKNFYEAIGNDLNTAQALAVMWDFIKNDTISPADKKSALKVVDQVLGLGFTDPQTAAKLKVIEGTELPSDVQKLVAEREEARMAKDFARSDLLRTQLEDKGYLIKDTSEGQKITKK
jgi:cysteinyl-tRNA synthetase